jgi:hypothetical protein
MSLTVQRCNWINQTGVQCGQPLGHIGEHGNGLLTAVKGPHTWHEYVGKLLTQPKFAEPFGVVWTNKSTIKRCLWSSATGRCIYELGHTIQHREESRQ